MQSRRPFLSKVLQGDEHTTEMNLDWFAVTVISE